MHLFVKAVNIHLKGVLWLLNKFYSVLQAVSRRFSDEFGETLLIENYINGVKDIFRRKY